MASRPTKYQHVTGNLPRLPGVEPERRDIVEAVKAEILGAPTETFNIGAQIKTMTSDASDVVTDILMLAKRSAASGACTVSALARAYAEMRGVMDAIAAWKSSAQVVLDAYEMLMLEKMEVEGLASLRMEDGASVSTYVEPYGQVVDKERFRLWCVTPTDRCTACGWHVDEHDAAIAGEHVFHPGGGLERSLQLWPSTMNSLTKERLLAGEAPPPGVEVFAKTMVRLNKA